MEWINIAETNQHISKMTVHIYWESQIESAPHTSYNYRIYININRMKENMRIKVQIIIKKTSHFYTFTYAHTKQFIESYKNIGTCVIFSLFCYLISLNRNNTQEQRLNETKGICLFLPRCHHQWFVVWIKCVCACALFLLLLLLIKIQRCVNTKILTWYTFFLKKKQKKKTRQNPITIIRQN